MSKQERIAKQNERAKAQVDEFERQKTRLAPKPMAVCVRWALMQWSQYMEKA